MRGRRRGNHEGETADLPVRVLADPPPVTPAAFAVAPGSHAPTSPAASLPGAPAPAAPAMPPAAPSRRRARRIAIGVVVVLAVLAAATVGRGALEDRRERERAAERAEVQAAIDEAITAAAERAAQAPSPGSVVYETILPSLVVVRTDRVDERGRRGLGSGVIVSEDGLILTSLHVIEGATRVRVVFSDGTESPAEVTVRQPERDLAVLQPTGRPDVLVPAVLGGGVGVGDPVFAVGHPLGLVGSLSSGVVSALDRNIPIGNGRRLEGLIQFDAAVNPGNSGGPLLNAAGQVVGVVTALANPSEQGFFVGIGFAVPIGAARGAAGGPSQ